MIFRLTLAKTAVRYSLTQFFFLTFQQIKHSYINVAQSLLFSCLGSRQKEVGAYFSSSTAPILALIKTNYVFRSKRLNPNQAFEM